MWSTIWRAGSKTGQTFSNREIDPELSEDNLEENDTLDKGKNQDLLKEKKIYIYIVPLNADPSC